MIVDLSSSRASELTSTILAQVLIVLQIEAQANEHEALKVEGFPGIFLYPSGKNQTPIPYSGYDRSLKVSGVTHVSLLACPCLLSHMRCTAHWDASATKCLIPSGNVDVITPAAL